MNSIDLYSQLEQLKNEYDRIAVHAESRLSHAPDGTMRTTGTEKHRNFYYRASKNDKELYLGSDKTKLISALAQKKYDQTLLRTINTIRPSIDVLLNHPESFDMKAIYEKLSPARKKYVIPEIMPDDQFIEHWLMDIPNAKNTYPIHSEIYSENGEHVRSKSEKFLADAFAKHGIIYQYEVGLILPSGQLIFPDFRTLRLQDRKTIYFEHCGAMDDPAYVNENFMPKIVKYIKNGYIPGDNLILTFESSMQPLGTQIIDQIIENTFDLG